MPRYVILAHDHPFLHWDLMLESGGALRTWRLAKRLEPDVDIAAERLGDHRLAYLDYEGPLSGGRGYVTRWDAGTFEWLTHTVDSISVRVVGEKLRGELIVNRAANGSLVCRYAQG